MRKGPARSWKRAPHLWLHTGTWLPDSLGRLTTRKASNTPLPPKWFTGRELWFTKGLFFFCSPSLMAILYLTNPNGRYTFESSKGNQCHGQFHPFRQGFAGRSRRYRVG